MLGIQWIKLHINGFMGAIIVTSNEPCILVNNVYMHHHDPHVQLIDRTIVSIVIYQKHQSVLIRCPRVPRAPRVA